MTLPHLLNIAIHVSAGMAAILIGFTIIAKAKGTQLHRHMGKLFCVFALVVCGTAALGLIVFRFLPLFSVITLLVSYQLIGGWRAVYTQHKGPSTFDAVLTMTAILIAIFLAPVVSNEMAGGAVIIYSTFGALVFILIYDALRWLFPRAWYTFLWRYEHSYKLLSSLFGMLSAFVGNSVRMGQPWSQIIPSIFGLICISYFFYRLYSEDRKIFLKRANT